MRTIVFGDTGGHAIPFFAALQNLGIDPDELIIPEGIQIVHLGDLIHKGPDSNIIIMVVNQIMIRNPDRWHQILGNHEYNYIQGAPKFWRGELNTEAWKILQSWFHKKKAQPAFYLPSTASFLIPKSLRFDSSLLTGKGILFTHAGVTRKFWKSIESPATAKLASEVINSLPVTQVAKPGIMLDSRGANPGPVWALSTDEVFNSWNFEEDNELGNIDMPFVQVHGHTAGYYWRTRNWYNASKQFREATKLSPENRVSYTKVANSLQIGCDPAFSNTADLKVQPYFEITTP